MLWVLIWIASTSMQFKWVPTTYVKISLYFTKTYQSIPFRSLNVRSPLRYRSLHSELPIMHRLSSTFLRTFGKCFCSHSGLPGQCPRILTKKKKKKKKKKNILRIFSRIRPDQIELTSPERACFFAYMYFALYLNIPSDINRLSKTSCVMWG